MRLLSLIVFVIASFSFAVAQEASQDDSPAGLTLAKVKRGGVNSSQPISGIPPPIRTRCRIPA